MKVIELYTIYLSLINIISLICYILDRKGQIENKELVSPSTLLGFSMFGGNIGFFITQIMYKNRIKEKIFLIINILFLFLYSLMLFYIIYRKI